MSDAPTVRTIGLLGGMSWESTAHYYRRINEGVRDRVGGLHSARIVMISVDFAEIADQQARGDWQAAGRTLALDAARIEAAGAGALVLCTNSMHRVADAIEEAISIPLLHLADATAASVREAGLDTIVLLGTRFTMEMDFYRDRLEQHGLRVVVPDAPARAEITLLELGDLTDLPRFDTTALLAETAVA